MVNAVSASTIAQALRQMDADGSRGLSLKEFTQGRGLAPLGIRQAIGETNAKTVFTAMDTDKNGQLSAVEFATGAAGLSYDVSAALLAAQEKQSPVDQMLVGLKSGFYSSLTGGLNGVSSPMQAVLAAYQAGGKF